jgi:transposase
MSNNNTLFKDVEIGGERKRSKKGSKPVFKEYNQSQLMLLPPSLEELIPESHMVRVVNKTIEQFNIEPVVETYKGGGTSRYHPRMMIKVIVYAYLSKIYSSRKTGKALRGDVNFMWLSGMSKPDFRSINNFRSGRMKEAIDKVFGSMVEFCIENKYVRLENYFVDGTKIEADANRYSYVWAKNTKRYKQGVQEKIKELLKHIDEENEKENQAYGDKDLEELGEESEITSEKIRQQVERLNRILEQRDTQDKEDPGTLKKAEKVKKELEEKYLPKMVKYEEQERILSGRNSYSKTDSDATFLRDKQDQVVPAYNVLAGTENQIIMNYTIHQTASETDVLPEHIRRPKEGGRGKPVAIIGDSTFGSQENYECIEKEGIGNYLKYNTYHYEKTRKYQTDMFHKDHFPHDEESDSYECPGGRKLRYKETQKRRTSTGYETEQRVYECEDCSGCTLAEQCKKGQGNRSIRINPRLEAYKAQARANLESEQGRQLRKLRGIEIESVFGDIKWNQGYRRFRLRGREKVNVEFGLLSMAHNIKKIALIEQKTKTTNEKLAAKKVA